MQIKPVLLLLLCCFLSTFVLAQVEEKPPRVKIGKGKIALGQQDTIPPTTKPVVKPQAETPVAKTKEEIASDTTKLSAKAKRLLDKAMDREKKAPLKAVLFSAIIPGSGQAFNKRYWKIPIVYAGLGAAGYFVGFNTREHKKFKFAYQFAVDTIENNETSLSLRYTPDNLETIRNNYRNSLELSYIGLVVVYVLTGIDAFVDAHLQTFDVSDDLSLDWEPKMMRQPGTLQPAFGIGLTLRPRVKEPISYPVSF